MSEIFSEQKKIYRTEALRHRERMDIREEDTQKAVESFFAAINPAPDQIVACYWPIQRELDTSELLHRLLEEGITCCLPVVQKGTKELSFIRWIDGIELEKGEFGTIHPKIQDDAQYCEPDILVVPLLAFDRKGHRLGYGGGYYDTTLNKLRAKKDVISVGWAYAQQAVLFNLPAEAHDEGLDFVITPKQVHSFKEPCKDEA
ncbi:MAG: 5-formyltetrahydrofolate cyclo-ligase [Alphaproteobacteria bacterium]